MAEKSEKWEKNVAGMFYVDQQCIDCVLCQETAPDFFRRNDDEGHSYVYKQPQSPEDIAVCTEALQGCPVEAIGADGED
jgi:ferredoxin